MRRSGAARAGGRGAAQGSSRRPRDLQLDVSAPHVSRRSDRGVLADLPALLRERERGRRHDVLGDRAGRGCDRGGLVRDRRGLDGRQPAQRALACAGDDHAIVVGAPRVRDALRRQRTRLLCADRAGVSPRVRRNARAVCCGGGDLPRARRAAPARADARADHGGGRAREPPDRRPAAPAGLLARLGWRRGDRAHLRGARSRFPASARGSARRWRSARPRAHLPGAQPDELVREVLR